MARALANDLLALITRRGCLAEIASGHFIGRTHQSPPLAVNLNDRARVFFCPNLRLLVSWSAIKRLFLRMLCTAA